MTHDVFISHSSKDKSVADAVCATLEGVERTRCWIAPRDVLPGQKWEEAIVDAIAASRVMVVILSASSNESDDVMNEVQFAASEGVVIVPFRIEDVSLSKSLRYHLGRRHWLDALDPPLEKHLKQLSETVAVFVASGSVQADTTTGTTSAVAQVQSSGDVGHDQVDTYDIFVSVESADRAWANRNLVEPLQSCLTSDRRRPSVWFDTEPTLKPGELYTEAVSNVIANSCDFVVVVSPGYFDSLVRWELIARQEHSEASDAEGALVAVLLDQDVQPDLRKLASPIECFSVDDRDWFVRMCSVLRLRRSDGAT